VSRALALLAVLACGGLAWCQVPMWDVEGDVVYQAQDGLSTWSGTAPLATAELAFDPAEPEGLQLVATVRPADFRSDVALRDLTARRTVFDVDRHPEARAVASVDGERTVPEWRGGRLALPVVVDLTLHGVTRRYALTVDVVRAGEGFLAETAFVVSLEAHGMRRPRLLAWVTEDAVQVRVTLRAHPLPAPTPTTR
jgi:polyisoprenoid-binding protein YceI